MGASHLTAAQRRWIYRLGAEGWSLREIAREIGFSHQTVWGLLRKGSSRPARSGCWDPGPGRLSMTSRGVVEK
jgi:IS30 family transposase